MVNTIRGAGPSAGRFWDYLRHRELDYLPSSRLQWWLVAVITIAWATEQFERLRLSPVLVYFLDDFDLDLRQYGLLHLAGAVATGVGSWVLGGIADRHGRRPAIVWPMAIYLLFLVGMASAPNVWVYVTLSTLGAFLIMGMSAAVNAAVRDVLPRVGRAMGYAFIGLAWTIGAFMTQGVAALTIPIWPGWRPQHWIGVVFASAITVLVWVCYRDLAPAVRGQIVASRAQAARRAQARPAAIEDGVARGRLVVRSFHIWAAASVLMWWGITYTTFVGMLPTYLAQWHGVEPSRAAALASGFFLLAGVVAFAAARFSDRTGLRKLTIATGAIVVGSLTIAASALPRDATFETLLLWWLAIAVFAGVLYPSWCALLSENAEDISAFGVGRAFGLAGAMGIVTGLVMALVLPQVVERWGWDVWMIVAGCCSLSNVVWISFAKGPWLRARLMTGD
jgi:MFS family permease